MYVRWWLSIWVLKAADEIAFDCVIMTSSGLKDGGKQTSYIFVFQVP